MIEKGSKPEDELKKYWFCTTCKGILRPVRGRSGGGKFVVSQKRPDVGIKGAISSKKIYPRDAEKADMIAREYFLHTKLNQAQVMGVHCPKCNETSVTLTLSFKFNKFTTQTIQLPYSEQVKLYRSWFRPSSSPYSSSSSKVFFSSSKSNFCSQCGGKMEGTEIYCMNCGQKTES